MLDPEGLMWSATVEVLVRSARYEGPEGEASRHLVGRELATLVELATLPYEAIATLVRQRLTLPAPARSCGERDSGAWSWGVHWQRGNGLF
jgi:hypothetical protein